MLIRAKYTFSRSLHNKSMHLGFLHQIFACLVTEKVKIKTYPLAVRLFVEKLQRRGKTGLSKHTAMDLEVDLLLGLSNRGVTISARSITVAFDSR